VIMTNDGLDNVRQQISEHKAAMAKIREDCNEGKLTLEEAATAEVAEIMRFNKVMRDGV